MDSELELVMAASGTDASSLRLSSTASDLVKDEMAQKGSLSPQLELLRQQGTDDLADLYAEEEAAMFIDEPMSLPADFASSGSFRAFNDAGMSGISGGGDRPSSVPAGEMMGIGDGPTTWPHSVSMLQLGAGHGSSQPVFGVSTPDRVTAQRLFALPRLPGSLTSFDDGQVAEEDSIEFRENLNHLNVGCVEKVGDMEKLNG